MKTTFKKKSAFTVIQLLVTVAIIAVIAGISVPAILDSKARSEIRAQEGTSKTLNEAITRARELNGDTNPIIATNASDGDAAIAYLIAQGYLVNK